MGRLDPYEHLMLRADGTLFPVAVRSWAATIGGSLVRITAVRDVSGHARFAASLRESEARYRTFIETCSDAIFVMDVTGQMAVAVTELIPNLKTGSAAKRGDTHGTLYPCGFQGERSPKNRAL
jgi:hypothetical protein